MFEALARAGFVVIAIDPDATNWSSGRRRAALACAMIWAREDPSLSPHLADVMAILGHSRGGGAAWLLTRDILNDENLPTGTALDEWEQCATVTMSQKYAEGIGSEPTDTNLPIDSPAAPPFLAFHGAINEDAGTNKLQPLTTAIRRASSTLKIFQQNRTMNCFCWHTDTYTEHGEEQTLVETP